MLVILLYHRSFLCRYGNPLTTLESHFQYLKSNYPIIAPFESLHSRKWNICLSFDDATYDFYYQVYPLLKQYQVKAVLSVPVRYIAEEHLQPSSQRLEALKDFSFQTSPPSYAFCSFKELEEMVQSGLVTIASHGMDHVALSQQGVDLDYELHTSKHILEERLKIQINAIAFPYGKYNRQVIKQAKKNYELLLRIGNGLNFSWRGSLHQRINADEIEDVKSLFLVKKKCSYLIKAFI
jgi:peptidoglycan/xylan/chitin deacetylase (PgdA/CDA1 family)